MYTLEDNLNLTCLLVCYTFGGTQYPSFWSTNAVLTFWISCALNTDVCVCVCVCVCVRVCVCVHVGSVTLAMSDSFQPYGL